MDDIILECPHCKGIIIVDPKQINCAIFRHGTLKANGTQVNPHAPKEECDRLIATNKVNGCCKPFKMIRNNDTSDNAIWIAVTCEYI